MLKLLKKVHRFYTRSRDVFLSKKLWRRARSPTALRKDGVCLAFDVMALTSLSQLGRDFVDMLRLTSIPFQVFDRRLPNCSGNRIPAEEQRRYLPVLSPVINFKPVLLFANGFVHTDRRYLNVDTPFWEFEEGLLEEHPDAFEGYRRLVVFSDFCMNYLKRIVPSGVSLSKIRYPLPANWRVTHSRESVRVHYGLAEDDFVAFFHFNFGSGYARKNPEGVVRAFSMAFKDVANARLVLKTAGYNVMPSMVDRLSRIIEESGIANKIVFVKEHLTHDDILNLVAASDVYTSCHRGEGFGIGMLEAMRVGTPVIATNYGGNTEFCREDTAFLVDYDITSAEFDKADGFYPFVRKWPHPREEQAAAYLRQIYECRDIGHMKAQRARQFVDDYFSVENFENDVRAFLYDLDE